MGKNWGNAKTHRRLSRNVDSAVELTARMKNGQICFSKRSGTYGHSEAHCAGIPCKVRSGSDNPLFARASLMQPLTRAPKRSGCIWRAAQLLKGELRCTRASTHASRDGKEEEEQIYGHMQLPRNPRKPLAKVCKKGAIVRSLCTALFSYSQHSVARLVASVLTLACVWCQRPEQKICGRLM
ncbi:hypothetical protein TRVL_03796 [Trypanosoma vivax]|nr:hypothetical protein TRVL_03796 [Trypanosoma vivax]